MKTRVAIAICLTAIMGACLMELPDTMGDTVKELNLRVDSLSSSAYNSVSIRASADNSASVLELGVEVNGERIKSRSLSSFDSTLRVRLRGSGDTLHVRAYAVVSKGDIFSPPKQLAVRSYLPKVDSLRNTLKAHTMLAMSAAVTDDNGLPVTERGFCWNTTGNPTVSDTKVAVGKGVGAFSDTIKGLSLNTTGYHLSAYATNEAGTTYTAAGYYTMYYAVTGVALNKTATTLTLGGTEALTATVQPDSATNKAVTWKSSNTAVATVSGGLVTAVTYGTAVITVTTADGSKTATCTVTVTTGSPVSGVTLNRIFATLGVSETLTLTATVQPTNATNKAVTWTSSNNAIATVSSNGVVTGIAEGTATITATTQEGGYTASCEMTIIPVPVTGVTLNRSTAALEPGVTLTLTATIAPAHATNKAVTWTSSNPDAATVNNNGYVAAMSVGTATITVTTADGNKTASCAVTVGTPVTSVALNKTSIAFGGAGETETLTATVQPSNANIKTVAWTSDNTAVATVSDNGLVTAVGWGTATITVTSQEGGKTATCAVTVGVTGVTLNKNDITLWADDTETLTATVQPSNAVNKNVSWTSSNTAVATVNNGIVNAVAGGSATITVTTQEGSKTATCEVTVAVPAGPTAIGGVMWAAYNVDSYQRFATRPDMYTKFYQWNRSAAWAATGYVSNASWETNITDATWTINPCPAGWRLPTQAEYQALHNAGTTWANANARGNAVAGRFYGPGHATCSLPGNMTNCVFLPAGGYRLYSDGTLSNQGSNGCYWSSTQTSSGNGYYLYFNSTSSNPSNLNYKSYGFTLRCVQ